MQENTNLDIGETMQVDLGDGTKLTMRRLPDAPEWDIGDVVVDRERDNEDQDELLVVGVSEEPIKNINVGGINTFEANKQYGYSPNEPTTYIIYKNNLLESIGGIPDDLNMFFHNQKFRVLGVKAYPFPASRLKQKE